MDDREREWQAIRRLIEREKAEAMAELRRRPLAPVAPAVSAPPPRLQLYAAMAPVAASLLVGAGLVALWLLRAGWQGIAVRTAGSEILAGSLFYATAGQEDPASRQEAPETADTLFIALAETALRPQPRGGAVAGEDAASRATVERGDPEKVRRAIGRAIRDNAFERTLIHIKEFHAQEA